LLKVALDIHQILMLKNKIYKYLCSEIFKNFITILLSFSAIAWVVKAVNFLDLMVEDGYGSIIYFKYTLLSLTTIITRFIPLAFLLSLTISIIKFERQQEWLILWTSGLAKVKIANIFLLISFIVTLTQLILSLFVNPFLLNKSRSLLSNMESLEINTVLRSNDFSDTFKDITFYIDKKNIHNELLNIFIKDVSGKLSNVADNINNSKNSTIIAKKGFIDNNKLILFEGAIQTLNVKNVLKSIQFEKTELGLSGLSTTTIKIPKLQETSSSTLLTCLFSKEKNLNLKNCPKNDKKEIVQTLSRRLGAPLYIPLISIITSFLLAYKKEKKFDFLKKYILFALSFSMLISVEILLKYTGYSAVIAISYFVLPIIISFLFYIHLLKKITTTVLIK
jgi:lipopolysaccharide export system permease protein